MSPTHGRTSSVAREPAGSAIDPRELQAARKAVDGLLIALKTYTLFPAGNVNVKSTLEGFERTLAAYLEAFGQPLVLDTCPGELMFHGEPIFPEPGRTKALSYQMSKDGVLQLALHPGIGHHEVLDLLDVFRTVLRVDADDDDFVTLLWEKDCTHIQAIAHDTLLDPGMIPEVPSLEEMQDRTFDQSARTARSLVDEGGAGDEPREHKQALDEVGRDLVALGEEERKHLDARIHSECSALPLLELVDILMMLFAADRSAETFNDIARLLRTTLQGLLAQNAFGLVHQITAKLIPIAAGKELLERYRQQIVQVFDDLGEGPAMRGIVDYLEEPRREEIEPDLLAFLGHLHGNAGAALLPLLLAGRYLDTLVPILATIADERSLGVYRQGLDSQRQDVVHATLDLLLRLADGSLPQLLPPLLSHADSGVRQRSLTMLLQLGDGSGLQHALRALDDDDPGMRRLALEALAKQPRRDSFRAVWRLFEEHGKRGLGPAELDLVLTVATRCDPELAVSMTDPLLERRAWFSSSRKPLEELQRHVVHALARCPHPAVRRALALHAAGKGEIAKLCRFALQSLDKPAEQQPAKDRTPRGGDRR